ncbi:hypothetical protein SGLAM104S_02442 [Streptomyces glaucescens]
MAMTTHAPERAMVSVTGPDRPQETHKGEPPRPHAAPERSKDRALHETYTVETGDSLWEIPDHHYGDGAKWWALYGANDEVLERRREATGARAAKPPPDLPQDEAGRSGPATTETNAQAFHEAINESWSSIRS